MVLKIEEFNINYITAIGGKSVNGFKGNLQSKKKLKLK